MRGVPPKPRGVIPCVTCGHPTREWKTRAEDAPGTRQRRESGECIHCHKPDPGRKRITEEITARRERETQQALSDFLTQRRARLARHAR